MTLSDGYGPQSRFALLARTQTADSVIAPVAYDCIKIVVVRAGGVRISTEFGSHRITFGDVLVLAANTLCGAEPEGCVTTTTIYLDRDYLVDQVFWQYYAYFGTRDDASRFLNVNFAERGQVVRLESERVGTIMLCLDRLAALSNEGLLPERFFQAQASLARVLGAIAPLLSSTTQRPLSDLRDSAKSPAPWPREIKPLRAEVREAATLLRADLARRWSVSDLAAYVHLSPSQLRRLFTKAFGRSPIAYLTVSRASQMAHLLKSTNSSISAIAASVGWSDPGFAAQQFRRTIGVTPSEYRRTSSQAPPPLFSE